MVTPELVKPIPSGVQPPMTKMPLPFLKGTSPAAPQNPSDPHGPLPKIDSLPIELLEPATNQGTPPAPTGPQAPALPLSLPSPPPAQSSAQNLKP